MHIERQHNLNSVYLGERLSNVILNEIVFVKLIWLKFSLN